MAVSAPRPTVASRPGRRSGRAGVPWQAGQVSRARREHRAGHRELRRIHRRQPVRLARRDRPDRPDAHTGPRGFSHPGLNAKRGPAVQVQFFRSGASTVPASGMTGPADIPDPPAAPKRGGLRARISAVAGVVTGLAVGVPRVLVLSCRASPRLTVGLGLATVVVGLIPVATAMTARLLMNTVVSG